MRLLRASFSRLFHPTILFVACACFVRAGDFSWRFVSPTPTGNSIRQVEFLNGQFVAVGDAGTLLTSTDGAQWVSQSLPATYNMVAVTYANGRYVLADESSGSYAAADAVHWTITEPTVYYYWSNRRTTLLASGNGIFLRLMGASGASQTEVETSTDGLTWRDTGMKFSSYYPSGLTFFRDRFIAVAGGKIWNSIDGVDWTKATTGDIPVLGGVAHSDAVLVAARQNAPYLRSTDGLNWVSADKAPTIGQIVFINGFFFAREDSTGACLRSTDGLTWAMFTTTAEPSLFNAVYGNGVYIGFNSSTPAELMRSIDGVTWTNLHRHPQPMPEPGAKLTYGNGVFLSGGVRSSDGEHWQTDTFVHSGSSSNPTLLYFCRDRFLVYQDHAFYVSADGRAGRNILTLADTSEAFGSPFFAAGKYRIPLAQGALVSVDGETWTRDSTLKGAQMTYGNGQFVRTTSNTIETSPDGITWESRYTQTSLPGSSSYTIGAPLFGNGHFLTVISWINTHGDTGNYLLTSDDGITWSWPSGAPTNVSTITFTNGVFVSQSLPDIAGRANPHGSNRLPSPQFNVSRDGVSWQSYPIPTATVVSSFAGNDSVFLASSATGLLATSFPAPSAPSISDFTHAGPLSLKRNDFVSLSVTADGASPFSYQWRRNGVAIPNANQASYIATEAGTYDVIIFNVAGSVTSPSVAVTMNDSWLANVSSRAYAGAGEDLLIQGFVARSSPPEYPQTVAVLARAVGPSLTQFNLHDVMANPKLELHRHSDGSILAQNDRWYAPELVQAFQKTGAFALPTDSEDAAIIAYPASGAYSFTVTGANGGQGIVLSELYDLSPAGRLVNLSARAHVGSGDRTLIAGFVIAGGKPLKVLIRGVGPTLSSQGIKAPLVNPKLTLFDSAGQAIHNNDNWNQARNLPELRAATQVTGAFPLAEGSNDAAMLESLDPGIYTVHVTSMDDTSGVALVEIYEVP